jgi:hypothetical protein
MADNSPLTGDVPDNGATGALARAEKQHSPTIGEGLAESVLAEACSQPALSEAKGPTTDD